MNVQLPDGSQREVPEGATVADVAASIGRALAKAAIAGKVKYSTSKTKLPLLMSSLTAPSGD